MPRYAQIKCDIYDDLVDEGYSQEAIAVYLFYSITSQNLIGLYRTVSDRDRVSAHIDTLSWEKGKTELESGGKVFWKDGYVWIVGKAKFVKGEKLIAAAKRCFYEIPDRLELKRLFAKKYDTLSMGHPLQDAPIPKPIPKPKPIKRNPLPSAIPIFQQVKDRFKTLWPDKEELSDRQIGLLIGTKKRRRNVYGFGFAEAVLECLSQITPEYAKEIREPFVYLKTIAGNPGSVEKYKKEGYRRMKLAETRLGRIFDNIKKEAR